MINRGAHMEQLETAQQTKLSPFRQSRGWQQFRRNRLATLGLVIVLILWGATLLLNMWLPMTPMRWIWQTHFSP